LPQIDALMAAHRSLRVDLRLDDRTVDLISEGVDVAIRGALLPMESPGLVAHRLFTFTRVLVAAPGYLKRRGAPATPEALARHAALWFQSGFDERAAWRLSDGTREVRAALDVVFRSNALLAIRAQALRGAGVALLPDWLVAEELASRRL